MSQNLSLTPVEEEYTLDGKGYILREIGGEGSVAHQNAAMASIEMVDGKIQKAKNAGNLDIIFLSWCLYTYKREEPKFDNIRVPEVELRSWPNRVLKKLVKRAKEISEVDQPETKEALEKVIEDAQKKLVELEAGNAAKNELSDSEAGST